MRRGIAACLGDGYEAFRQPKFECCCCEITIFRVCGASQNFYLFSLYRSPNLNGRIYDCLLESTAVVQSEDVRASFLFVDDLNGHHQQWLGSMTTNSHGVTPFDFLTVSGCDQLVVGLTNAHGRANILHSDLLITDVLVK